MYFGLSEDQLFFQENVSRFLEDHASLDVIKKITEGEGQNLQKEINSGLVNLGINGLLVPEEYGGLDLDLLFAAAVSQSLGENRCGLRKRRWGNEIGGRNRDLNRHGIQHRHDRGPSPEDASPKLPVEVRGHLQHQPDHWLSQDQKYLLAAKCSLQVSFFGP